jgi:hypothetical protein
MVNKPEFLCFPEKWCMGMKNVLITFGTLMALGGNHAMFTTSINKIRQRMFGKWSAKTIERHLNLLTASGSVELTRLTAERLRVHFPHLG